MTHLGAIILGFVEGVTEFLPVSSSGHLIVVRELLGLGNEGGLAFDATLQFAASLALLVYFRKDIWRIILSFVSWVRGKTLENSERVMLLAMILGTIPAIVIGLLVEDMMETIFRNVKLVGVALVLGSILFWYAEKVSVKDKVLTLRKGIAIGFFQCLALIPGVSRSGATISGGLILGLTQEEAVRFSFLLSIPILFGAGLKKMIEVRSEIFGSGADTMLLSGSLVSFITSLLAISFLIRYLKNHTLKLFIWYRIGLALAIFLIF